MSDLMNTNSTSIEMLSVGRYGSATKSNDETKTARNDKNWRKFVMVSVVVLFLGTLFWTGMRNQAGLGNSPMRHEAVSNQATPVFWKTDAAGLYTIESVGPYNPRGLTPFGPQTDKYSTGKYVTSIGLSGGTTWLTSITLGYGYDAADTAPMIGHHSSEYAGMYKCKSPSYFNKIKFRMLKCSSVYCHDQLIRLIPFCSNAADLVLEPANSNVAQMGHAYAADATSVEYEVTFPGPFVGLSGDVTGPLWSHYGGILDLKFWFQKPAAAKPVCFPAKGPKDTAFGAITVEKAGTMKGIKLTHTSGFVNYCGTMAAHPQCGGNWGGSYHGINVYITKNDGVTVLYPTSATTGFSVGRYEFYSLTGYTYNSPTLEFNGPSYAVTAGEKFRLYFGEVYKQRGDYNNEGTSCAKVELIYA